MLCVCTVCGHAYDATFYGLDLLKAIGRNWNTWRRARDALFTRTRRGPPDRLRFWRGGDGSKNGVGTAGRRSSSSSSSVQLYDKRTTTTTTTDRPIKRKLVGQLESYMTIMMIITITTITTITIIRIIWYCTWRTYCAFCCFPRAYCGCGRETDVDHRRWPCA